MELEEKHEFESFLKNKTYDSLQTLVYANDDEKEKIKGLAEKFLTIPHPSDSNNNQMELKFKAISLLSNEDLSKVQEKASALLQNNEKSIEKNETYLHQAISKKAPLKVIEYFIKQSSNLNQTNDRGRTPLELAICSKSKDAIKLLIEHGADLEKYDAQGNPPLHQAVSLNASLEIIELFLNLNPDLIHQINKMGDTLFHQIVVSKKPSVETIQFFLDREPKLLEQKNKEGDSPLHMKLKMKSTGLEEFLIYKGADLESTNNKGERCRDLLPKKFDEDLLNKKLLSASWTLAMFPGGRTQDSNLKQRELIEIFQNREKFSDLDAINHLQKKNTFNFPFYPEGIKELIKTGETVIINSGWANHFVQLIFYDNYLLICNKGVGRQSTAVKVYEIDRSKADQKIISQLNVLPDKYEGKKFIYETLPKSFDYKLDQICEIVEKTCEQQKQKGGHCWWVSPKTGILAFTSIQKLCELKSQSFENDLKKEEIYKTAMDSSKALYKYFSEFTRIEMLKEYLEKDVSIPDHHLVKEVANKLESKEWKYFFQNEDVVKKNLEFLKHHTDENLPPLYSKKDIIGWLKEYQKKYDLTEDFELKFQTSQEFNEYLSSHSLQEIKSTANGTTTRNFAKIFLESLPKFNIEFDEESESESESESDMVAEERELDSEPELESDMESDAEEELDQNFDLESDIEYGEKDNAHVETEEIKLNKLKALFFLSPEDLSTLDENIFSSKNALFYLKNAIEEKAPLYMIEYLVKIFPDMGIDDQHILLDSAANLKSYKILDLLMKNMDNSNLFQYLIKESNYRCITGAIMLKPEIIHNKDYYNSNLLHFAINKKKPDLECIKFLIKKKPELLDELNKAGKRPLDLISEEKLKNEILNFRK